MKLYRKQKRVDRGEDYRFFVIVKQEGQPFKIESGWSSLQEAKDMVKELPWYLNPKAVAKAQLSSFGLNPGNKEHWLK